MFLYTRRQYISIYKVYGPERNKNIIDGVTFFYKEMGGGIQTFPYIPCQMYLGYETIDDSKKCL